MTPGTFRVRDIAQAIFDVARRRTLDRFKGVHGSSNNIIQTETNYLKQTNFLLINFSSRTVQALPVEQLSPP